MRIPPRNEAAIAARTSDQLRIPEFFLASDEPSEPPVPVAEIMDVDLDVEGDVAVPSATLTPYDVPVMMLVPPPAVMVVVVNVTIAVVVAEQAVHEVHGALAPQSPLVQPVHVEPGHPFPSHQLVHAPLFQDPDDPHGPHPPPKGPSPPLKGPLLPDHAVGPSPLLVAEKVASGAAAIVWPA